MRVLVAEVEEQTTADDEERETCDCSIAGGRVSAGATAALVIICICGNKT